MNRQYDHSRGRISLTGVSVALALMLGVGLATTATLLAKDPPVVVTSAAANAALTELSIQGEHFGAAVPDVYLAGVPLVVLGWSATSITAALPAGHPPGSFRLVVVRTLDSDAKSVKSKKSARTWHPRSSGCRSWRAPRASRSRPESCRSRTLLA